MRDAFAVAERWLTLNRDAINAINVYPVPDGDTGTNMLLTWRAALAAMPADADAAGTALRAVAHGALLGARGNSGVILSQMLRGLAEALGDAERVDCAGLTRALTGASAAAYAAVPIPVEGTMLTVMREGAAAAEAAALVRAEIDHVMATFVVAAQASVERTPDLLPRLRDAGVVDAGGLGIAVLFEGVKHGLAGTPLPAPLVATEAAVALEGVEHEGHGYCTEFVILGRDIDRAALEHALTAFGGDSLLVVGDAEAVHVHVHMPDPGPALSAGVAVGALSAIKIDNMQTQHETWAAGRAGTPAHSALDPGALPAIGLVAVARGAGIVAAFRDLGATRVIDGGPTGKASAGELLEACTGAGRDHVLLLPNDKDVLMAAEQAARAAGGRVIVVPSRTVVAGLAAAVAYSPDGEAAAVAERMGRAIAATRSVEVTRAVRDAVVDGVRVSAGDGIALVDGVLVARADDLDRALLLGLERAVGTDSSLVTVYLGADAPQNSGERVEALLADAYPELEVEVLAGGQPFYPFLLSVE
ncbi:MAG: DAK2 domain-containing protein [Dehalococcoidia bacterium]